MTKPAKQTAQTLKGKRGLERLIKAFGYSCQGLQAAFKHEAAFKEECILAIILIPVAIGLPVTTLETLLLILSVLGVLLVELLNSAIEAVVDRFGYEIHPLSGRAKDIGSAAVLIALIMAAITWAMIVGPLLWDLLQN